MLAGSRIHLRALPTLNAHIARPNERCVPTFASCGSTCPINGFIFVSLRLSATDLMTLNSVFCVSEEQERFEWFYNPWSDTRSCVLRCTTEWLLMRSLDCSLSKPSNDFDTLADQRSGAVLAFSNFERRGWINVSRSS